MPNTTQPASRRVMFAAFCLCSIAIAVGYVALRHKSSAPAPGAATDAAVAGDIGVLGNRAGLLFSSAAFDGTNGFVGIQALGRPDSERYRTALRCDRVYFAGGSGICLAAERGMLTTYSARTFGPDFKVRHSLELHGVPSRTRVSPNGRRGVVTVFVSGDSYSSTSFSTRTTLIDMASGQAIADLETFAVTRAGAPFKAVDFNFWGVTFAKDGNRFFATLGTGGINYLVEGNLDARTARVLREGVECPSLSPDNTHIAFKSRVSPSRWRLHVLDVATLKDAPLAETRSVDDQAEWIDDESVAYMLPNNDGGGGGSDVWAVSVTSQEPARVIARQAYSPVMLQR
jgi:hypothetical protein